MYDVCAVKCNNYEPTNIEKAMDELIKLIGGLDFVKPPNENCYKSKPSYFYETRASSHYTPSTTL